MNLCSHVFLVNDLLHGFSTVIFTSEFGLGLYKFFLFSVLFHYCSVFLAQCSRFIWLERQPLSALIVVDGVLGLCVYAVRVQRCTTWVRRLLTRVVRRSCLYSPVCYSRPLIRACIPTTSSASTRSTACKDSESDSRSQTSTYTPEDNSTSPHFLLLLLHPTPHPLTLRVSSSSLIPTLPPSALGDAGGLSR